MMLKEQIIKDLSEKRYSYIKMREESWNKETNSYSYDPQEIDSIGVEILLRINEWKNELSFEFIFEELTKLGYAPNLLYDDDGRFAITGEGLQSVVMNENGDDVEFQFFVEKKHWKNTVREALDDYLKNE